MKWARDPRRTAAVDTLYTRQRKVFSPFGISYEKKSQTTLSPTDAELANGANWCLVHSGEEEENDPLLHRPQGHPHCPHPLQRLRTWRACV